MGLSFTWVTATISCSTVPLPSGFLFPPLFPNGVASDLSKTQSDRNPSWLPQHFLAWYVRYWLIWPLPSSSVSSSNSRCPPHPTAHFYITCFCSCCLPCLQCPSLYLCLDTVQGWIQCHLCEASSDPRKRQKFLPKRNSQLYGRRQKCRPLTI